MQRTRASISSAASYTLSSATINVGFHIGAQDVTVDFSGPLTDAELADVERAANWVIWQNAPVTIAWPAPSELAQLNYRSKKERRARY